MCCQKIECLITVFFFFFFFEKLDFMNIQLNYIEVLVVGIYLKMFRKISIISTNHFYIIHKTTIKWKITSVGNHWFLKVRGDYSTLRAPTQVLSDFKPTWQQWVALMGFKLKAAAEREESLPYFIVFKSSFSTCMEGEEVEWIKKGVGCLHKCSDYQIWILPPPASLPATLWYYRPISEWVNSKKVLKTQNILKI